LNSNVEEEEEQVEISEEYQLGPFEEEEEREPSGVNPMLADIFRHGQDPRSNDIRYGEETRGELSTCGGHVEPRRLTLREESSRYLIASASLAIHHSVMPCQI
jgi:hypothetical protein